MARHPLQGQHYTVSLGYNVRYPFSLPHWLDYLKGTLHKGVDCVVRMGTPLVAAADGKWVSVQTIDRGGYGVHAVLQTLDGDYRIWYTHLTSIGIPRVGKLWNKGETIAWSGNSGSSTNPHYHFAVQKRVAGGWTWVNPDEWVREYQDLELVDRVNEAYREVWGENPTAQHSHDWQQRVVGPVPRNQNAKTWLKKTYEELVGAIDWHKIRGLKTWRK